MFQFQRFISQDFYLSRDFPSDGSAGPFTSKHEQEERLLNAYMTAKQGTDLAAYALAGEAYFAFQKENLSNPNLPPPPGPLFEEQKRFEQWKQATNYSAPAVPRGGEIYFNLDDFVGREVLPEQDTTYQPIPALSPSAGGLEGYGARPAPLGDAGNAAEAVVTGAAVTTTTAPAVTPPILTRSARADTPYDLAEPLTETALTTDQLRTKYEGLVAEAGLETNELVKLEKTKQASEVGIQYYGQRKLEVSGNQSEIDRMDARISTFQNDIIAIDQRIESLSTPTPYTPITASAEPIVTSKAPARSSLTEDEKKEIEKNIKGLYTANPKNNVGFFTRSFGDFSNSTTEEAIKRLEDAYKGIDESKIAQMKLANVNFPKQAAEAALAGGNQLDNFIKKERSKVEFVQGYSNALNKTINTNQAKELANAADRFIDPKQKGEVAVDPKGAIEFVKKFQEKNKDGKDRQLDFPINLVTDRKNAPMLQLAAKNPELAATAIEAFRVQGKSKGLTAYKAVDLGMGIKTAMEAANKHTAPESQKLAAKNVANLVMNDAASIGFFTGKAKLDDKKIEAIKKGLKSEPKSLKNVPDTKEGRLMQAASNAAKYPKVYAALTAAMSKDGKTKVTNRDLNKAFEALGPKADILEKSNISVDTMKNALGAKASATKHLSDEAKKEYIINKEKEPKIKKLIDSTPEFKDLSSTKKSEIQNIMSNLITDGAPDPHKTKAAIESIKGIVGGNAELASSLITKAGEIDREARQDSNLGKKVENQFKDTAKTTVAENLVRGGASLPLNDMIVIAEKSNLEKQVGAKVYKAVVDSIKEVGAEPSLSAIKNVMDGLGSGTIKALQASNMSTNEIKSALLSEGAGKTNDRNEQKSTKLIQDLAGDNESNKKTAAESKDPKELAKAEKALSVATEAASKLNNLAVKKINEQGGDAVATLTRNASTDTPSNTMRTTTAHSGRGSSASL